MRNNYLVKLILLGLSNGLTAYSLVFNFKLNLTYIINDSHAEVFRVIYTDVSNTFNVKCYCFAI